MEYFRPGLEESITLPPHPENSSEIGEVVNAVTTRTAEDVTSIRNHDHEPFQKSQTNIPIFRSTS